MYDFAIVALLALASIKLVDFLADLVPAIGNYRSLLTFVATIGAVWMLDYSLFEGFGIGVRNHASGVWLTGFIAAGMTVPWRAVFGFLSHDRATGDETLGQHVKLHRAA